MNGIEGSDGREAGPNPAPTQGREAAGLDAHLVPDAHVIQANFAHRPSLTRESALTREAAPGGAPAHKAAESQTLVRKIATKIILRDVSDDSVFDPHVPERDDSRQDEAENVEAREDAQREVNKGELERLRLEHRDLDAAIAALDDMAGDRLQLQRLKKRKLALRDRIRQLEDQVTPDIIA